MQDRIETTVIFRISEKERTVKSEFILGLHDVPTAGRLINRFYPLEVLMDEKKDFAIFPEAE